MKYSATVILLLLSSVTGFVPTRLVSKAPVFTTSTLRVATLPTTPSIATEGKPGSSPQSGDRTGAMIDLSGVALSGLKGKALSLYKDDFPTLSKAKGVIPKDCFTPDTATSLGYLAVSLASTAACCAVGLAMLDLVGTSILTLPIWSAYAVVTGTVAMGLWVLAHECGHGAFSANRRLQDVVGYVLHTVLLVPYFSWQRSHAVHHKYTNNMELGETHVPEKRVFPTAANAYPNSSYEGREFLMNKFGEEKGLRVWGGFQGFLHLVLGWPAYLLIGATGGDVEYRGMTNHFYPDRLTGVPKENEAYELFPGRWKEKVLQSDIGIALVIGALAGWGLSSGWGPVLALYGGPYLIVNCWLVLYTWLQHTDVDVPHFSMSDHTFTKGAFHTIDRPYDKLDPFGIIDFLHHRIGTTHVAHHLDCTIPHYKAKRATEALKENFPDIYLYDPTPIWKALWRIARGCTVVEKREEKWIWSNEGLDDLLES